MAIGRAATSFLGLSPVVEHSLPHYPLSKRTLSNALALSVKVFQNVDLPGVLKEVEFFRRNNEHFDLIGPWPFDNANWLNLQRFVNSLAEQALSPEIETDGRLRARSAQVHHFACHRDTSSSNPDDFRLELASRRRFESRVWQASLGDLGDEFARTPVGCSQLPLVFFNACGSAHSDPNAFGFPSLFLSPDNS